MMDNCNEHINQTKKRINVDAEFFKKFCVRVSVTEEFLLMRGNELYKKCWVRIQDRDMNHLCDFLRRRREIVQLDLAYNEITDKGLDILTPLLEERECHIRQLNLMCNNIKAPGIVRLANLLFLRPSPALRSVRLNGNRLGREGGFVLAETLSRLRPLMELDIAETDQDTRSLVAVIKVLQFDNPPLRRLDISRPLLNGTIDHVADCLGQMFKVNTNLNEIHLQKMNIGDSETKDLVEGLLFNATLQHLDLCANAISMGGADALSTLILAHPTLSVLELGHNNIPDDGARLFSFALPYSQLTTLDLSHNKMTDTGICDILYVLPGKVPIKTLLIWGNEVGEEACKVLKQTIEHGHLLQACTDVLAADTDGTLSAAYYSASKTRLDYYLVPRYSSFTACV